MKNELIVNNNNNTLQDALKLLEDNKTKILFVVNDKQELVGTLTDGDVRRAIVNNHLPNEPLYNFMNTNPIYVYQNDSLEYKLSLFNKYTINLLAILDENKKLVDIVSKEELNELPNYAILMAGGLGSRLGELTKDTPKPLLKVGNKPILETIIESFMDNGIKNFLISVNYKSEKIKEYFKDGNQKGIFIKYIEETKRLGTAGALSLIDVPIKYSFFVMNGDILVDINFKDMLEYHNKNNFVATMGVISYKIQIPYGVIETNEDNCINDIVEKPEKEYFINAGVYILNPEIIKYIPKNEYFDMPMLFKKLIQESKKVGVYKQLDNWLDIGHIEDYYKAQKIYKED